VFLEPNADCYLQDTIPNVNYYETKIIDTTNQIHRLIDCLLHQTTSTTYQSCCEMSHSNAKIHEPAMYSVKQQTLHLISSGAMRRITPVTRPEHLCLINNTEMLPIFKMRTSSLVCNNETPVVTIYTEQRRYRTQASTCSIKRTIRFLSLQDYSTKPKPSRDGKCHSHPEYTLMLDTYQLEPERGF